MPPLNGFAALHQELAESLEDLQVLSLQSKAIVEVDGHQRDAALDHAFDVSGGRTAAVDPTDENG